jgi:hypothetical protein
LLTTLPLLPAQVVVLTSGVQQAPATQTSIAFGQQFPPQHCWPLPQTLPSALAGLVHCPDDGSHVPGKWHSSGAGHGMAVPWQEPSAWQISPAVQRLRSSQEAPALTATPQ